MIHARALGVDLSLHDGLALEGVTPLAAPGPDPTTLRLDPARVAATLAAAGLAAEDGGQAVLGIAPGAGHGWIVVAAGVGAAVVSEDGRLVSCAPDPGSPDWPALLAAQIVPLVATLRGYEVFHAAGIVHRGRAHLLCGARGVGKTSIATQLVLAGAQLLADDVVAVDERLVAHPGAVVLHLRDSERGNVERHRADTPMQWGQERHGRSRLTLVPPARACPIGGIHLLVRDRAGAPVTTVGVPQPWQLLGATFNLSVRTRERLVRQLALCDRLSREVPVTELRIVPGRAASEIAAELLSQLRESPPARA